MGIVENLFKGMKRFLLEVEYMKDAVLERGLVQVYTGDGKGKSTAAFGLAVRAAGQGLNVRIIQFLKTGDYYGEIKTFEKISNISIESFGRKGFIFRDGVQTEDVQLVNKALNIAEGIIKENSCDLLILDEINIAVQHQLVSEQQLLKLIEDKPAHMELVLTGRNALPSVIEKAHLVTEMKEIKHPYKIGIKSRKGIEF